jgi:alpha-aminoadipate carrier protein LysW
MVKSKCSECGADLDLKDPVVREIVECPDCGSELEVVSVEKDKVELKVAEIEGEDWGE